MVIPIIRECLNMHKQADEDNLWKSFFKRMLAHKNDDLKNDYLREVLPYGIQDLFIKKCVNRDYFIGLQNDDKELASQYSYLLTTILTSSIEGGDLKVATKILENHRFENTFSSYIKAFNKLDDNWLKQREVILSSRTPEGTDDCFTEMLMTNNDVEFSPRSLIVLATLKANTIFLRSVSDNYGEDIQSWLETVPNDDLATLGLYLNHFNNIFINNYIQVIANNKYAYEILLAKARNSEERTIELILKAVEPTNGKPIISSLLHRLRSSSSALKLIFRSYQDYPEGTKRLILNDARHRWLNADSLLSPIGDNVLSIAAILSSDAVFSSLKKRFNPHRITASYWQYKQLFEAGLIEEISRETIVRCIREEHDLEKAKAIMEDLDEKEAEAILDEVFPDSPVYRAMLSEKWKQASTFNYICIDIESDRASISQAAAVRGEYVAESYNQSELQSVLKSISSASVLIGHNIKSFDLPVLYKHGLLERSDQFIWDTYEMEMALEPTRFSYALETAHTAKEDALLCEKLFWNQLYRICTSGEKYEHIKALLPIILVSLLERITIQKFAGFFREKASLDTQFFREGNSLEASFEEKLKSISGRSLIIAPEDLWAEIAARVDACFPTANSIQFSPISKSAVYKNENKYTIKTAILKTFIDLQDNPLVAKLSKAVRVFIKDEELTSFLGESTSDLGVICTDSFGVDKLGNLNQLGITDVYTTGYEIESRINRMAIGDSYCAADLLKSDYGSRLVMQLSGATFTPVSRNDCHSLGCDDIPADAKNLWMQKDEKGQYQVYCNRVFSQFIAELRKHYPTINQHGIDWVFSDSADANISIVSSKKQPQFDARIKRVNPASLYRSMYWVYQFALLEGIETSQLKVLYISNSREIPSLTHYAESKGYYIPDSAASIQRRIELCKDNTSSKTLIIIGPEEFNLLRQAKVKYPYCLIWDNLDTDCLQVMWRGMLPFGDEPDYGAEVDNKEDNDKKKDTPPALSCILGLWPMVKYYCHQIFLQDQANEVCLLDPSFDDYKELEKSFLARRQEVELWSSDALYQEDLKVANQHFAGKRREEDLNFKMDEVMATIWQVFVAPKLKGTTDGWTEIQRKALPVIFQREKNTLVSIPTGGGKSVLFQGAALYRAAFTNRLSIVVTPLKALMQDQVEGLHDLGFVTNVEYLNSDKTRPETSRIYRKITGGEIALLYITPERFRSRGFRNALASRMQVDAGLEYIIFDEAHCISQWGLDFRPEYLSAAQTCSKIAQDYPDTRIELFSATVTGQVQNDIESIITPIEVISSESSYNPIRNHIGMQFEVVKDTIEERVDALYQHIASSGFNPTTSRILVFCRRKRDTEEGCEILKSKFAGSSNNVLASISDRIGYFHAGMDTNDRAYAFSQYKNGEFLILFATKAFGMGMDIPNIHFVYHLNPPQFIEDYLQEVGRAGRSKDMYVNAGFNPDNPIPTFCFVSIEDFRNMKTLLAQSMLSWMNVRSIYKTVKEFIEKFQPRDNTKKVPIAVPDNIWKKDTANGATTDPTAFRLGLYWLEKMKRIEMGYYAPTTLDLTMPKSLKSPSIVRDERLKSIYEYIIRVAGEDSAGQSLQIYINDICSSLSIGQYSLFKYVIQGTKLGLFTIATKTAFDLTKIRTEEMKYCHQTGNHYFVIEAVFKATEELLSRIKPREATRIDVQKRNAILNTALASIGIPQDQYMPWHSAHSVGLSKTKSYIQDISFKRAKFIFDIVDMLPGASIKTTFDTGDKQVVQEVYLSSNKWRPALDELKKYSLLLLDTLIRRHRGNYRDFVWADLIAKLNLPESYQYFCNLISILRFLGFIKADGILSTGIEISLTKNIEDVPESPKEGLERDAHNEFTRVNHLKDIKFALMNAFSKVKKEEYDYFIKEYFKCESEKDYMDLLNLVVNENDPILLELQAGAIKAQEDRLDEQQRAIYDAPIDKDINVLAGPGSGKTHVLTLRCARLVYHEHILPQNILVLAYNRAVVEELKTRLAKLFGELGFGRAMSRLQIYTFHGLAKRYCRGIQNIPVERWEDAFLQYVDTNPGEFLSEMGNIQFILIDEFQDITQVRLDLMLKLRDLLTTPVSTPRFFTIGDINQSIYGFDRLQRGQSMDPMHYYNQLYNAIHPDTMKMFLNYRSYQRILDEAFKFVPNTDQALKPTSAPSIVSPSSQYVFIQDVYIQNGQQIGRTWHEEFPGLYDSIVNYNASLSNDDKEKLRYKSIAVFFRNNNEVYRGYARVRKMNLTGARIRVQGASSEFFRTRECNSLIRALRKQQDREITSNTKDIIKAFIDEQKHKYPNWDEYYLDLTYALVQEFLASSVEENLLFSDLADFLEDIGEKDDGQLSKIYQKYYKASVQDGSQIDIILTTMHKVKGLEFDVVVVTASYQPIGYKPDGTQENNLKDIIGEERRLYFVAYTRAKRLLCAYRHPRELNLAQGLRYRPTEELQNSLGVSFSQGFDKLNINYTAKVYSVNDVLRSTLKKDDPISLKRNQYGDGWDVCYVTSNGQYYQVGKLAKKECQRLNQKANRMNTVHGLFVNDIFVWRFDDTLRSDGNNQTSFAMEWSADAKAAGFIYVVDFAGYIEF